MKKLLSLLVLSLPSLWAQNPIQTYTYYSLTQSVTLSSTAGVWTIQQPSTVTKTSVPVSAVLTCSSATTATVERDGTAATTTTATPVQWNPSSSAATTKAYTSSNVGVGTVVANYSIPANSPVSLDVTGLILWSYQTSRNVTIRTASVSATCEITLKWYEQ